MNEGKFAINGQQTNFPLLKNEIFPLLGEPSRTSARDGDPRHIWDERGVKAYENGVTGNLFALDLSFSARPDKEGDLPSGFFYGRLTIDGVTIVPGITLDGINRAKHGARITGEGIGHLVYPNLTVDFVEGSEGLGLVEIAQPPDQR